MTDSTTVCIRCGKPRVVSKTYTETINTFYGTSVVTRTETVCPDQKCQKIVDDKLAVEREKYLLRQKK